MIAMEHNRQPNRRHVLSMEYPYVKGFGYIESRGPMWKPHLFISYASAHYNS